ncbi:GNAT family N-acetyltransferase [Novosphingobium sp.]|uniref:GNAT family N-acetyltransferase n=1 Tax=Novosphingobium sp. TaxID=1874826 RepID=UPI00333F9948
MTGDGIEPAPIALRPATMADAPTIVALNAAVVAVTSPMDVADFTALLPLCAVCTVVERAGTLLGFIMAMQQGAGYDNGNFRWFSDRLNRFVYIDRVVIDADARGLRLGSMLYDHLSRAARQRDCLLLAAEMDLIPANPVSLKFHAQRGFVQLGTRELPSGKVVSMQVAGL